MTDLGTLPGGVQSWAYGISDHGLVAGASTVGGFQEIHAFLGNYSTDIGTLGGSVSQAKSIIDDGEGHLAAVGQSALADGAGHAFWYYEEIGVGTILVDMGTLGGRESGATAITSIKQQYWYITGWSLTSDGFSRHAFLYQIDPGDYSTLLSDLGTLGGPNSQGNAINDNGDVAGGSFLPNFQYHAFIDRDGTMYDLGTLGGTVSEATAINNAGQVAGRSFTASGATHAFLYSDGSMIDLGTLDGGSWSWAYGMNNYGQVVGYADLHDTSQRAFLYSDGEMVDLNSFVDPNSRWFLTAATGINDYGQITGNAFNLEDGSTHAFLLTPDYGPLIGRHTNGGMALLQAAAVQSPGLTYFSHTLQPSQRADLFTSQQPREETERQVVKSDGRTNFSTGLVSQDRLLATSINEIVGSQQQEETGTDFFLDPLPPSLSRLNG